MDILQLGSVLESHQKTLRAKGYDAAHAHVQIEAHNWGVEYTTWVHALIKEPTGFRSVPDASRRRGSLPSLDAALEALAEDVADIPARYTAADLAPWFDPQHEINQVRA